MVCRAEDGGVKSGGLCSILACEEGWGQGSQGWHGGLGTGVSLHAPSLLAAPASPEV